MECEHFVILITYITAFLDLHVTLIDHKPKQIKNFIFTTYFGSCGLTSMWNISSAKKNKMRENTTNHNPLIYYVTVYSHITSKTCSHIGNNTTRLQILFSEPPMMHLHDLIPSWNLNYREWIAQRSTPLAVKSKRAWMLTSLYHWRKSKNK